MMPKIIALALASLAVPATACAATQSLAHCFTDTQFGNWTASPDARTLYFRIGANRYYRIDLARECSPLKSSDARLITRVHGGGLICSAVDLDLKASEGSGGIVEACFVKGMTELSAAEAAALPKGLKP
jgi:hypothetical protein